MRWSRTKPTRSSSQRSIFDQAERAKQQGIEASYQHADTHWKVAAKEALLELARSHKFFTADDFWGILDAQGITTGDNRALGAVIQGAHRSGMIRKTGDYRESHRRHKAPIPVWESYIFRDLS